MSFNVFKVRYSLAIPDPDMPGPRYHTVIFVATDSDGFGFVHHVTGDLVTGMHYERKIGKIPEESGTFHDKELLGKIQATDYPARVSAAAIEGVCHGWDATVGIDREKPRLLLHVLGYVEMEYIVRQAEELEGDGDLHAVGRLVCIQRYVG